MKNVDIDTISRNRIVADTDTNFFVEAGAGSGKTTMLVSRMVAMVEQGKDISKICAITFTKAAANEFYERFQKLLIERSSEEYVWEDTGFAGQLPAPTELTRQRCADALKNIDLCFMGTIDSFCNMVLSEHPSEAGIPSDSSVISNDEEEALYKEIYVGISSGLYGKELQELSLTFSSLHRNPQDVFALGLKQVMNNRNVHFNFKEAKPVEIDKKYADDRKNLLKAIKCMLDHPEIAYSTAKSNKAWESLRDSYKTLRRRWSTNYTNVIWGIKNILDIRCKAEAMDNYGVSLGSVFTLHEGKKKWLELNTDIIDGLFGDLNNLRYDVSMTLLVKCIPVVEHIMRDKGSLTYFDYLYYLRNMLKKDAEGEGKLIRYIYDRHSYFLIDEFQDTNPMQGEVFFYLSDSNPKPLWSECIPKPGSLFIVGDPKQSIYRFRSADVTSFLNVKQLFQNGVGEILYLSKNFRSTRQVCSYFNDVFTEMLPEENENQSKYELIPLIGTDKDEFQGIYTYKALTGPGAEEEPKKGDCCRITEIIKTLINNEEFLITTKDSSIPRKITFKDIMIITANKMTLEPIRSELAFNHIPTKVEGKIPFEINDALMEIYKLYAAIADPESDVALITALVGRLLRFSEGDMMAFRKYGGIISMNREQPAISTRKKTIRRIPEEINRLKALHDRAINLSPASLFELIMDEYEVYRMISSENMEVLYYTLELLRTAEKRGLVVSLKDGTNYLNQLVSGLSEEERCLSLTDDSNRVHLANLHKVKGLEAPVVILAAARKKTKYPANVRYTHGTNGAEGFIFSVIPEGSKYAAFETKQFDEEKKLESESLAAEETRLIYVAATRARNALIISDCYHFDANDNEVHNSKWQELFKNNNNDFFGMKKKGKKGAIEPIKKVLPDKLYLTASEECVLSNREAEVNTFNVENPSNTKIKSKMTDDTNEVLGDVTEEVERTEDMKVSTSEVHGFPTVLGTMVHKLLEVMVSSKSINISAAVADIISEYSSPLISTYKEQLNNALATVSQRMLSGGYDQVNTVPADLLSTLEKAEEVSCEVPFCYKEETEEGTILWNGIMDLVYKLDGKWHIVDYKTNADCNDLDKKYQNQLQAYVKAFKAITGETADAMTYHIDI